MDSNIQKINNIPFLDVLSKLGYIEGTNYVTQGDVIKMKENGKITDGWRGSIKGGFLKCYSGDKGSRIEGDRLNLVKAKFNLGDADAFRWFEQQYRMEKIQTIKDKWNGLSEDFPDDVKEYFLGRGIDLSLLKGIAKSNHGASTPIRNASGLIKAIQTRTTSSVHKDRFRIEKDDGGDARGLFFDGVNSNKIYVVEGLTDYLTLRQFTGNVIGLVTALGGAEELKKFNNKTLVYIADDDEAGVASVKSLKEKGVKFLLCPIKELGIGVKDVNELWRKMKNDGMSSTDLFNMLDSITERKLSTIELAVKEAERLNSIGVIKFGDRVLDIMTGGLMRGSTMLINGPSGQGKTTLSIHMLMCLLKNNPDIRIAYYSLETNTGRQLAKIISFMAGRSEKYVFRNLGLFKKEIALLKGLEIYSDIRDIEEIQNHITENNIDVAFIDFAQKVRIKGIKDETEKMVKYAQDMQDFSIDNGNVAIISLSQTSMGDYNNIPILQRKPKGSGALFESSDTTMNVGRDEKGKWCIGFIKTKNIDAEGWWTICNTQYDWATSKYTILPPENLKSQEKSEKTFDI